MITIKKKWLVVLLAVIMVLSFVGGTTLAQEEYPAAPAIAAELLRDAGVEQLGPYVSQVARETRGREAEFQGLKKSDDGYREAVRDFLSNLGIVFSPARYSGMVLWLDGSSFVGEDPGTAVEEWPDVSGKEYNATKRNGTPTIVFPFENDEGTDFSLPAVRFNGSTNFELTDEAASIASDVSGITVFVARQTNVTNRSMVYTSISTNVGFVNQRASTLMRVGNIFALAGRRLDSDPYTVLDFGTVGTTAWHLHTSIINYAAAEGSIFVDGTHEGTGNFLTSGNTSDTDSLRSTIGSQSDDAFYFTGDIAEIIIYNRALSDAERSAVDNYLMSKYGM